MYQSPMEQAFQDIDDTWQQVGRNLSQALLEVATELGGEQFALQVAEASVSDSSLPNADGLKLLQDQYPDSGKQVMERMKVIAEAERQQELSELHKHRFRRYGRALLTGLLP